MRSLLRGDIAVAKTGPEQAGAFTASDLAGIQALLDEGAIDGYTIRGSPSDFADFTKFKTSVVGRTDINAVFSIFTPVFFERNVFPYYGEVSANGRDLWELMQADFDVVVTRNLANRHNIDVGDGLKLSDIDQPLYPATGSPGWLPTAMSDDDGFSNAPSPDSVRRASEPPPTENRLKRREMLAKCSLGLHGKARSRQDSCLSNTQA